MTDVLRLLRDRADAREPVYTADDVAVWPKGVVEQLVSAGLLTAAPNATAVVCDACAGDHVEEVVYVESPPGTGLRAYIRCPLEGRVAVPLERLRRWEVNFRTVAQHSASALDTCGDVEEVVPVRVWLNTGGRALPGDSLSTISRRARARLHSARQRRPRRPRWHRMRSERNGTRSECRLVMTISCSAAGAGRAREVDRNHASGERQGAQD